MKIKLDPRSPIKLFYKVRNLVSRFLDPSFNTFQKFEYKVNPTDDLNDLKKLRYVRNLESGGAKSIPRGNSRVG